MAESSGRGQKVRICGREANARRLAKNRKNRSQAVGYSSLWGLFQRMFGKIDFALQLEQAFLDRCQPAFDCRRLSLNLRHTGLVGLGKRVKHLQELRFAVPVYFD